jgi:hypothetical protein
MPAVGGVLARVLRGGRIAAADVPALGAAEATSRRGQGTQQIRSRLAE